jgi:hypothetical protein
MNSFEQARSAARGGHSRRWLLERAADGRSGGQQTHPGWADLTSSLAGRAIERRRLADIRRSNVSDPVVLDSIEEVERFLDTLAR